MKQFFNNFCAGILAATFSLLTKSVLLFFGFLIHKFVLMKDLTFSIAPFIEIETIFSKVVVISFFIIWSFVFYGSVYIRFGYKK